MTFSLLQIVAVACPAGMIAGWCCAVVVNRLTPAAETTLSAVTNLAAAQAATTENRSAERRLLWTGAVAGGLLFTLLAAGLLYFHCQQTPAVRPAEFWRVGRAVYQCVLLALLLMATGTDLRDYVIPDSITAPGVLLGVAAATVAGDLQIAHLWIDWNAEIPGLRGPWIPEWIRGHPHLHGLAWSVCGLLAGGCLTWLLRLLSRWMLGREALGFGDVTLMAMIGSFTGWQPVVVIVLLAPLCGLAFAVGGMLCSSRPLLPYGPYLAAATVLTLLSWRWIWMFELSVGGPRPFAVRRLFGDPLLLGGTAVVAVATLCGLLGLCRLYRAIPVRSRRADSPEMEAAVEQDTAGPSAVERAASQAGATDPADEHGAAPDGADAG